MTMTELTYPEFVEKMQQEVKEQTQPEVCVETYQAVKNNDTRRTGLVLQQPGVDLSPAIYLEEFYERYRSGAAIPALAGAVLELYERLKIQEPFPYRDLLSFASVREHICCKLIGRASNAELLSQIPYDEYLDLAVVYYVRIEQEELGSAMLLVSREHLEGWGVSRAELARLARENTERLLPLCVEQLSAYLYALSNQEHFLGASAILYPGAAQELHRRIGGSYYLLPSSIHEFLAIPESYGMSRAQLKTLVEEVNRLEVTPEEVLSQSVYYYDSETGRLL